MKYELTRNHEVGVAQHGWLHAKHYFSFASYYNPQKMGFGKLRVLNDDVVEAGSGFGTHPHRDMEIITIPLAGAVSHEDSAGNKGTIRKGEVQVMSAGTGILHSEFNHSKDEKLNLFQIWIEPNEMSVKPRYGQKQFDFHEKKNQWTSLVSPMASQEDGSLKIHQEAFIKATALEQGQSLDYSVAEPARGAFLLVSQGEVEIAGEVLKNRDAMAISDTSSFTISANENSEMIVIEVPMA